VTLHTVSTPAGLQMGPLIHTPPWLVRRRPWPEFKPRTPWQGWVVILWCCFTSILGEAVTLHTVPTPAGLQMGTPLHTPPWLVIRRPWPEFIPRTPWHGWVVILWCCFTSILGEAVTLHTVPTPSGLQMGTPLHNHHGWS